MTDDRQIIPSDPKEEEDGAVQSLFNQLKLVWRLITDGRVSFLLKLLPFGSLVYLIMPDLIPFIIDDAIILTAGLYLFVELCPDDIVEEHRAAIEGREPEGDIVEGEFKEEE